MKSSGGSVAVMFADLAGSTRLYDVFGDARAKQLVDECLDLMRAVVARCDGEVIKTIGDELMCVLPDAEKAWRAAVDIQLRVSDLPQVEGHRRSIRIGFHVGFVIRTSSDVFGDTVNMAARMTGLAKGGQIMATCATVMQLPKILRTATRKIAALSIKGKEDSVAVCEIIWQTNDDLTMATPSVAVMQRQVQLNLTFRGDTYFMNLLCPRIMMGRDLSCNFVVSDKMASRQHAFIELRQEKFFLTDQSTNGTFVHQDGEAELVLRREEMMLQGTGSIGFGRSVEFADGELVRFGVVEA
ncbi:MAG: FHA domain-containing protein [Rhodoferax sp.]|uniref:adenylate/guanylate cyclase domain-containing protein n=1 Tax=Rhodoferax sp. TaxID=50421 RepID=UPI001B42AB09|nr:adenylate/guanylate cyclase domain-containing protein [Rhodoferax sp.]MBP9906827.1 FHA domain-containing protein [Rhodoferax sp.]